ncbi:hypothetical protein MBLNU230_g5247t1 [Neophaeotheca triangularis]
MLLNTLLCLCFFVYASLGAAMPEGVGGDDQQQVFDASPGPDEVSLPLRPDRRRSSIVLILSDDQDEVSNSVDFMPRLKHHLGEHGTRFVNHFTSTAICCPSRVSLWTGRQPHNTNVTDVDPPYGGFPKFISQGLNERYLPVWLQQAGYATYYTGKMFNSHTVENHASPYLKGWTGSRFLLDPGTYSYRNPIYQKDHEEPVQYQDRHTTELIQEFASELLDDASKSGQPFFLAIAPVAPHSNIDSNGGDVPTMTEPIPLPRHRHLFKGQKIPRTTNFNSDSPSGVSWVRTLPQLNESAEEYLDHYYRQRLRSLQGVDELVEQVVTQLDDAGILDDTYIFFSSDNGFHFGQHRLPPGKECGFEEDIRVPLYVRGPGISHDQLDSAVTSHIDLAPTFFEIAGIDLREDFDGAPIALAGGSSGQTRRNHEHVGVEYWGNALAEGEIGGFDGMGTLTVPNNTYKAIRVVSDSYNLYYAVWCNNEHELYDINSDPGQMRNIYSSSDETFEALPNVNLSSLTTRLDALMMVMKSCKGRACVEPWKVLHPAGDVESLSEAMGGQFDQFYREQPQVSFDRCEPGYIVDAEGPQEAAVYRQGLGWSHWT